MSSDARVALVTGASHGIGAAIAQRLAAAGHRLVVHSHPSDLSGAKVVADAMRAAGTDAITVAGDLADPAQPACIVGAALAAFGRTDVLVNSAGIFPASAWDEIELADWERVFDVNVRAGYLLTRAAVPLMRERGWGRIIFMSSGTFLTGSATLAHYAASKGAVVGLARSLALALGDYGITVNTVTTGRTMTPGLEGLIAAGHTTLEASRDRSGQAIKRLAEPGDVAGAFAFLASDDAGYMTGQLLNVDGGRTMY